MTNNFLSDTYSDSADNCFGPDSPHIHYHKTKVSDSSEPKLTRMECFNRVKTRKTNDGYPDAAILDENHSILGNCFAGKRRYRLTPGPDGDDGDTSNNQAGIEVCEITSE